MRVNQRQITSTLAYFGFIVIKNSFDGATENRAAVTQDLTLSLKSLLPNLTSKYGADDLPWEIKIAYPHPTLENEVITADADMPHGAKKQANAVELSCKPKHKRDLHLNGLPVQLRMAHDAYKKSKDWLSEGSIVTYPQLGVDVFEKKHQDLGCALITPHAHLDQQWLSASAHILTSSKKQVLIPLILI